MIQEEEWICSNFEPLEGIVELAYQTEGNGFLDMKSIDIEDMITYHDNGLTAEELLSIFEEKLQNQTM